MPDVLPDAAPGSGTAAPGTPSRLADLRRQLLPLLAWVAVALLLRWALVEPRWIPSGSMLPTLQLQDRVLVEKVRTRLHRPLPVGTVVVFHPPQLLQEAGYSPRAALIKRIVARPGDRVEVRQGRLWRNGTPVAADWAAEPMDYALPPLEVPTGHVLVLGDNRNASLDSHLWGPLPEEHLIGAAVWRYWPLGRFGAIRFSPPEGAPGASRQLG
ncbi:MULTISPECIES: signal peptidase I [Aphanothece]|uniref:signal peptidase I n=1 Tax=Aphanothece TaxID=1121 RepID=UPI003984B3DA